MKKLVSLALALFVAVVPIAAEPQIPAPASTLGVITMTGSAIPLVPNPSTAPPLMCSSMLIETLAGNAAVVYVLNASPGVTMAYNTAGTTTVAQLGFSSTQPGGSFTFPSNGTTITQSGGFDLRYWGLYGTSSDKVTATCNVQQ